MPELHLSLIKDPLRLVEIKGQIGKGSYGEVFRGILRSTGNDIAIKIIPLDHNNDDIDEGFHSIRKEIEILKECQNPHIVQYLGSFIKDKSLWILMEYCSFGSIRDIINATGKPLQEGAIAYVCGEALMGLSYLHQNNRIHRDIKSGNILLCCDGKVKLADFGVCAKLDNTMAKRNTFIGTPYWMSPEVIQENSYDCKADIWSLGITAIEMGEIYPPNSDIHPMKVLFKILKDPPPQLKESSKWSLEFQHFVAGCLVKDPNYRPNSSTMLKAPFIAKNRFDIDKWMEVLGFELGLTTKPHHSNSLNQESSPKSSSTITVPSDGSITPKNVQTDTAKLYKDRIYELYTKSISSNLPFFRLNSLSTQDLLASNKRNDYNAFQSKIKETQAKLRQRIENEPMADIDFEILSKVNRDYETYFKSIPT